MAEGSSSTPVLDGRFLVLEAIGRGGMARVYRAYDRDAERIVAIKVASDAASAGPSHPLAEEFRAWARVRHPNVVRVHELMRARNGPLPAGSPYLVLEHVEGRPAHEMLPPGRIAPATLEDLARRVLSGLAAVHEAGLVHRDLKPANVLVGRGRVRRVKLTDFGLAVPIGVRGEPGRISGSLPYLSPEAILGAPLDGRADLYGLGVLLYYLAVGRLPVPSRDPAETIRLHLQGLRGGWRALDGAVPERLARFIRRLTERQRDNRPGGAAEALALLDGRPDTTRAARPDWAGRAETARLRLAVDAARLGALRALPLPPDGRLAARLVREACVLAQIHGLGSYRLVRGDGASGVGRLVLKHLGEREEEAAALLERFRLKPLLPLGLLGRFPVWDRAEAESAARRGNAASRGGAGAVASFLLDCARRRTTILVAERGALRDPLARRVVERLVRAAREEPGSAAPGGMLLLFDAAGGVDLERAAQEQPLVPPQLMQT